MKNQVNGENLGKIQETLRQDIEKKISTDASAEQAALQEAEERCRQTTERLVVVKQKKAENRARIEEIPIKIKTVKANDVAELAQLSVKLRHEYEELEVEENFLSTALVPGSEIVLKEAQNAFQVKVLLTVRDLRDAYITEVETLVHTFLEPKIAAWQGIVQDVITKYRLHAIKDKYERGDIEQIHVNSPLCFDVFAGSNPSYAYWKATRHPLHNLTSEQLVVMQKRSAVGVERV